MTGGHDFSDAHPSPLERLRRQPWPHVLTVAENATVNGWQNNGGVVEREAGAEYSPAPLLTSLPVEWPGKFDWSLPLEKPAAVNRPSLALWAQRLGCILYYHHAGQLARRAWKLVQQRLTRQLPRVRINTLAVAAPEVAVRPRVRPLGPAPTFWDHSLTADELASGRLTLLNQTRALPMARAAAVGSLDWEAHTVKTAPLLWRFHLHYHEYLLDLADHDLSLNTTKLLGTTLAGWLEHFATMSVTGEAAVAWHPYVITRRVPVWARLHARIAVADTALAERMVVSLTRQVAFLQRHLEKDLGGNHLWDNARALALAGCFFTGRTADSWRREGVALLQQCLNEQLFPSGEHFERSPLYQGDLANGLFDLAQWLAEVDLHEAERFDDAAKRMTTFLDKLRHPDGDIPLFGDATLDGRTRRAGFLVHSDATNSDVASPAVRSGWVGDYYVHSAGPLHLLFDAGDLGPDHLPAHAHADLLGFELSAFGQRLLVDAGVSCYAGLARSACREATAHNVLTVDGQGCADVWSSFRMGRRGHVRWRRTATTTAGLWVAASHDGFRHLGLTETRRVWLFTPQGIWFCLHWLVGQSTRLHQLLESLHWHPEVALTETGSWHDGVDKHQWTALVANGAVGWTPDMASHPYQTEGVYAPKFNQRLVSPVTQLVQTACLPVAVGWALHPAGQELRFSTTATARTLTIHWQTGGCQYAATWDLDDSLI